MDDREQQGTHPGWGDREIARGSKMSLSEEDLRACAGRLVGLLKSFPTLHPITILKRPGPCSEAQGESQ